MKRAVFPGTFDPITLGHIDIIKRALPLFDELIVAIGFNASKTTMFSLEERIRFIEKTFEKEAKIKVMSYSGLTAHFCLQKKAKFLVRGLRNSSDFNYEQPIAQTNLKMAGVDTIIFVSAPEVSNISSTIVRDVMRNNGDFTGLVSPSVIK